MPLPLVERSEKEIARMLKRVVEGMEKVRTCRQVSVRVTGKRVDVDMHVSLDGSLRFEDVHNVASKVEREVKRVVPNARITIQTDPVGHHREDIRRLVKEIADGVSGSRGVHNIHIQRIGGNLCVDLHLEVSANMTVKQANEVSDQIERKLKAANPNISEITIHMESALDRLSRELEGDDTELKWYIVHAAKRFPEIKTVHGIKVRRLGDSLHLVFRCRFEPKLSMKQAHETATKLENTIKNAYPRIARIDIREEPA